MVPGATLSDRLEAALGVRPVSSAGVSGGCINDARRVELPDGSSLFVKTHAAPDPAMFPAEAEGLRALAAAGPDAPPVPEVIYADGHLLVLEWLPPGPLDAEGWRRFGRALAALHRRTSTTGAHGFDGDNFIGATDQPNPWTRDGVSFFGRHRLGVQVRLASDRGLLAAGDVRAAERVVDRLPELFAPCADEPAALIHGDLWSGNVHGRSDGVACVIDPATHFGFREADLAMTRLFGAFPSDFYDAYAEAWPLPEQVSERVGVFNLYHLLNHLNLFGTGYLGQVRSALGPYC